MNARTLLGHLFDRSAKSRARQPRRREYRRLWTEALQDRCLLTGILGVSPTSAATGTTNLFVTFTLDPDSVPPVPPSQVNPSSAEIGTIAGGSLARNDMEVTAWFDIPADETAGTKDVAVSFPGPNGTVTLTLDDAFTVLGNGLPLVSVAATDAGAAEAGLGTGTFVVSRAGSTDGDLAVSWSIGGSATEGDDFQTLTRSATIPDGQSSITLTLTPVDDQEAEPSETVVLSIAASDSYSIGSSAAATIRIADDDGWTSSNTYPIVDTGQTTFYDDTDAILEPTAGQPFYGQDAHYAGNQPQYQRHHGRYRRSARGPHSKQLARLLRVCRGQRRRARRLEPGT